MRHERSTGHRDIAPCLLAPGMHQRRWDLCKLEDLVHASLYQFVQKVHSESSEGRSRELGTETSCFHVRLCMQKDAPHSETPLNAHPMQRMKIPTSKEACHRQTQRRMVITNGLKRVAWSCAFFEELTTDRREKERKSTSTSFPSELWPYQYPPNFIKAIQYASFSAKLRETTA